MMERGKERLCAGKTEREREALGRCKTAVQEVQAGC